MRISLVTVTYRSAVWLERLLPTAGGVDEVIVVDHSEDEAERRRLAALPIDRLVVQPNRGYGAGLNRGVRESSGDLLLLVNPDVRFAPGAIERLAGLAARPGTGAAGPQLLWSERYPWRLPHSADYTVPLEWSMARCPRFARALYLHRMRRIWSAAAPVAVPVLGGAVLTVLRERFEATGGFDERFFLFFEENDWCRRLRRLGYRNLVDPGAVVHHDWGHATGSAGGEHHARSLERYRRLHFPRWYLRRHPAPPSPAEPPLAGGEGPGCPAGAELLLVTSTLAIPAAWRVVERPVADVETLVPPDAGPARYHVLRRRGSRVERIRTVERPGPDGR